MIQEEDGATFSNLEGNIGSSSNTNVGKASSSSGGGGGGSGGSGATMDTLDEPVTQTIVSKI